MKRSLFGEMVRREWLGYAAAALVVGSFLAGCGGIRRLADRIGAAVAGSRAAVEAGLVDASVQVGQTGHTVAPDLYIAIGISGQIQHTAAITGARTIIAVNPDRTAPIFSVADYGLALPVEEALPQLMNLIPAVV